MDGWMDRWGQWEGSWREAPPLFMTHNNAFSDELQSNFELPAHACSLWELPFNAFDSRVWFPLSYIALWIQMAQMNSDLHQTSQPHGALMFTLFFTSSRRLFTLWSYLVKEQGVHLFLVKSWVSLCKARAFFVSALLQISEQKLINAGSTECANTWWGQDYHQSIFVSSRLNYSPFVCSVLHSFTVSGHLQV